MEIASTVVRFPKSVLAALKLRAAREGTSMADLIRRAVEMAYDIPKGEKRVAPKDHPFYQLVGSVVGDRNESRDHDSIIYDLEDPIRHQRIHRPFQRKRR